MPVRASEPGRKGGARTLLATSRASTSASRRTNAFFRPSGRMRVLILSALTSYNFLTASLIWRLFGLRGSARVLGLWVRSAHDIASFADACHGSSFFVAGVVIRRV